MSFRALLHVTSLGRTRTPTAAYALAAIFDRRGAPIDLLGRRVRLGLLRRRGGILDLVAPAGLELLVARPVDRVCDPAVDGLAGWAQSRLTGSLMLAARMPAVVSGALTAWAVYRLAALTTASRRIGMISVLILPAIPILAIGGVIITSDTPLVCCWAWAAVWAYRALAGDDLRAWVAAGVIGALGVLAKYSFLAFPASVGLFLILSPGHRRQLAKPGFWVMCLLCAGLGLDADRARGTYITDGPEPASLPIASGSRAGPPGRTLGRY